MGDSCEKHARAIEAAVAARSSPLVSRPKVRERETTSVYERLDYVEGVVGDSLEKSKRDLAAAHVKLDLFAVRVTNCEAAKEAVSALREAHESLTQEHSERHATIMQRVDYLEKLIGDSADRHAKELAKHKAAHSEAMAQHAKIVDDCRQRMDCLGKSVDDHVERHSNELKRVTNAHAQLSTDLERHGKKQSRIDQSHSTIGERVDALEAKVGELLASREVPSHRAFRAA